MGHAPSPRPVPSGVVTCSVGPPSRSCVLLSEMSLSGLPTMCVGASQLCLDASEMAPQGLGVGSPHCCLPARCYLPLVSPPNIKPLMIVCAAGKGQPPVAVFAHSLCRDCFVAFLNTVRIHVIPHVLPRQTVSVQSAVPPPPSIENEPTTGAQTARRGKEAISMSICMCLRPPFGPSDRPKEKRSRVSVLTPVLAPRDMYS